MPKPRLDLRAWFNRLVVDGNPYSWPCFFHALRPSTSIHLPGNASKRCPCDHGTRHNSLRWLVPFMVSVPNRHIRTHIPTHHLCFRCCDPHSKYLIVRYRYPSSYVLNNLLAAELAAVFLEACNSHSHLQVTNVN